MGGKGDGGVWGLHGGGGGSISRSYAVSAPADRDASQLYYSCLIISVGGKGGWGRMGVAWRGWGEGGSISRSYAVSAPADQVVSQLYYSCLIINVGGKGVGGGGVWGLHGGGRLY